MPSDILIGNPLGWVQARLMGGWRRALSIGIIYLTAVFGIMLILYRAIPWGPYSTASAALFTFTKGALAVLSVLQAALFVLVGSSSVSKAVQRDVTSGIIDSHRLTPMSGWAVVLGYLTGPNIMLVPLTAANGLLALGLALLGGHSPLLWLVGAFAAFCMGFTLGSLNLLIAMCMRKAGNLLGMIFVLGIFTGSIIIFLIPGLGLLTGFFSGVRMISNPRGPGALDPWIVVALGGQAILAALACIAASRKYLRADVPAFSWPLGLALLGFTALYTSLGVRMYQDSKFPTWSWSDVKAGAQWVASMCVIALVTFLPMAAAAQAEARWARHRALSPGTAGRRPAPYQAVMLLAVALAGIIATLALGPGYAAVVERHAGRPAATTGGLMLLVYLLAVAPVASILRWTYAQRERAGWRVMLWIILVWILPAAIDLGRAAYADPDAATLGPSWLMGCSPAGAWVLIAIFPEISLTPGLAALATLSLGASAGFAVLRRRVERVPARRE